MKGSGKIIEVLNEILTAELTGINQYFVHAKMCGNWGYERLAEAIRKESMEEMRHAEELIERILFLEGLPNLQRLGKVKVGEKVAAEARSRARARGGREAEQGDRSRHRSGRQRLARPLRAYPGIRRGSRELARGAARADSASRRRELSRAADAEVVPPGLHQ